MLSSEHKRLLSMGTGTWAEHPQTLGSKKLVFFVIVWFLKTKQGSEFLVLLLMFLDMIPTDTD